MSTNQEISTRYRPTIALAMGDPAGVSPELAARLLCLEELLAAAKIVVFGDRRILDEGAKIAGLSLDITVVALGEKFDATARPVLIDLCNLSPADVKRGEATPEGGAFALDNFRRALTMAKAGDADAV